jgi:hypothetical protein
MECRIYNQKHKEKLNADCRKWQADNKDQVKQYLKENKESRNKNRRSYFKKKRQENLQFRMAMTLRSRLTQAIRTKAKKGSAIRDLGCSIEDFIKYVESKFEPGMNWENWGLGPGTWQLDHIIEFRDVDLESENDLKRVLHYTNLQPLWFEEHNKKTFNRD